MKSILVVCIGNICRSPMAQALLARELPGVTVSSAGTGALEGYPADAMACRLMAERGLDISAHRARQIGGLQCQQNDLILTMDEGQRRYIAQRYPSAVGKIFTLGAATRTEVPDPFRQDRGAFEHALTLIETGTRAWAQRIRRL